jgi:acylphosphatase
MNPAASTGSSTVKKMKATAHVIVSGRVQGVSFRAATAKEARANGLTGWVRNMPDGRVEAVFQGAKEKIGEMLAWCRKGPPAARVSDVEIFYEKPGEAFAGFAVR